MNDITDVLPRMEDVRLEMRRQAAVALIDNRNPAAVIGEYLDYKRTVELMKNAERKLETRQREPEPAYIAAFEPAYFTV
jgi:hypothetical protein